MNEFLGSSPTRQAKMWLSVGGAVDIGIQKDGASIQASIPELHATLGGGGQQPEADTEKTEVKAGQGTIDDKKISPDAPKVKPEPTVVPPVVKTDGGAAMRGMNNDTPIEQKQAKAADTIRSIPTTSNGIPRSPGAPPRVPLSGDADPAKAEANRADASAQAQKGGAELRTAVESGRGSDAVQPLVFDESNKVRDLAKLNGAASRPVSGVEKFKQLGVPADVDGAIDEQQQAVMDTAFAEARGKLDEAVTVKDSDARKALDKANADGDALRAKADADQDAAVGKARGDIGAARENTMAEQAKALSKLESDAGSRQKQEVDAVYARVAQDEAKIDSAYTKAEADVDKEIAQGEKDAEAEKKKAEQASESKSWWDRVKDAVADAFAALTDAINAVLNAVRDAVKAVLDGVKKLASTLLDAASAWITDKLKSFGDWLKSQVTALLGSVFPELAKKLNSLIDAAVDYACEKVNQVAEVLKGAISALCDAIAGALDAVMAVFEAAVNFAVALAEAALTGDWAKVGMMVLEGILKLAGIPPEEFYAVVGKAEGTIGEIVDNPGGFLGNCIDAVGQGFGQFADNFPEHLETGVVDWVMGALLETGIEMPGTFDLAGVFDVTTQVLGLTPDRLRERAAERVGEKNVERVEFVWGWISSAVEGGVGGLLEHVMGDLGGMWDQVMGAIEAFLIEKVVKSAVIKIASMFNPVGAIVQAIMTAWNLYTFLRDQIQRIMGVVRAVVDSMADIAAGNIGNAANLVEHALGSLVPIAIDLLAKLLGLGGVAHKVKEVIAGIGHKVEDAIDKLIDRVAGWFTGGGKESSDEADKSETEEKASDEKKEGGTASGLFQFVTPKLVGRDPELGLLGFTITGAGRVKKDGGELDEQGVASAKSEAMMAAQSAVGKAVNAGGVTSVSGQLSTLSDQAKLSAGRGVATSGMSLDSLSITGIVLPPEVQKALDEKAAGSITATGLDQPVAFRAGTENHRIWVTAEGSGVAVMMASTPIRIGDKVEAIRGELKGLPKTERQKIGSLVGKAISMERQLGKLGSDAKASTSPAATGKRTSGDAGKATADAIQSRQQELAAVMSEVLSLLPEEGGQKEAAAETKSADVTSTSTSGGTQVAPPPREVGANGARGAALTKSALRAKKHQTPEDLLRASGEMSHEELEVVKGALKKNPRSTHEDPKAATAAVKPDLTDASGKALTNYDNADGTKRAPMTHDEKELLLRAHAVLAKDNVEGADMRKVVPNEGVGAMLTGQANRGAEKLGPSVRGSVGLARNTDGMDAEQTVAALGLDYEHEPSAQQGTNTRKKKGNYTEMHATGHVTVSEEVERHGLHYVDFKMTAEMEQNAGVAMSHDLTHKAKSSPHADVSNLGGKAHSREKARRDDPFAGTGATSSNAMVLKRGGGAGQAFEPVVNQELNLDPRTKRAGPGEAGYELQAGAQLKRRGSVVGEDRVIATLVEKADKDGKIVKEWELDGDLEKNERGHYKNKMDHATSEAAAKLRKPGEADAAYERRMADRKAMIAAQQARGEAEGEANGNPFDPGTAEFKSYNKKARQKAKSKADSSASSGGAPNGDVSKAAPKVKPPPTASAAPAPVAAQQTEAKDKVVRQSTRSAANTETASTEKVDAVKKTVAKSPAEEIEKILSPAAEVKPLESTPPKDFPERRKKKKKKTNGTTVTPEVKVEVQPPAPEPEPKKEIAPNPGLRTEHIGTGVDYTEFKGEAFVKGEGDANDIDPTDVKQGSLGNCYLLGGMAAVSRANPEHIRKLIKDNGDGTYDVTLYIKNNTWDSKGSAKTVTVDSQFPSADKGLSAKYARYADKGAKGPELWTMLIEKAWAVHKGTYTGIEGGKVNDDGKFAGAIALLTNLKEGYYTPSSISDSQLAKMISDALTNKMPVACDSKNLDKESAELKSAADAVGVVGNHAYAPKAVDLQGLTIDLQNPWGSSHVSGMKISDFKRFYRGLRIGS